MQSAMASCLESVHGISTGKIFVLTGVISVDIRERRQENCCMEESGNFRFCQMETTEQNKVELYLFNLI